ncbi:MAG TPA: hypothetical protein VFB66_23790 [Tepidisphaeraceae bacterium]|nr:hypothetical protein [Tepidisphaeraceae bacterium]
MSRLGRRIAALERLTAQRRRPSRCPTCRDWPARHILIKDIAWDGTVKRDDVLAQPEACPVCGWRPGIVRVEIEEVKDWGSIGRHGRR